MYSLGDTADRALGDSAQEIGFQFDGREILRPFRKTGHTAITGCGVSQRDNRTGMQVAIRRPVMLLNVEFGGDPAVFDVNHTHAEVSGQKHVIQIIEMLGRKTGEVIGSLSQWMSLVPLDIRRVMHFRRPPLVCQFRCYPPARRLI